MPDLYELNNAMPVAPLKIAALPSAAGMGKRINSFLVEFRKHAHNDKVKNDPAFQGYIEDNYLLDLDDDESNMYIVGSVGRTTAIKNTSDLDYQTMKKMHEEASLELSGGRKPIGNIAFRNWNKSAYRYDSKNNRYVLKKEINAGVDVPKTIKWNRY